MSYGFQIKDSSGRTEFDSTETTNGGVFVGQFTLPVGSDTSWKYITFDGSTVNTDVHASALTNFKGRGIYYIIFRQGSHDIKTGFKTVNSDSWPRIEYRNNNTTAAERSTSGILVFIK
jgi:hypothetical protein